MSRDRESIKSTSPCGRGSFRFAQVGRYSNLVLVEADLGILPDAKRLLEQAIEIFRQAYAADHPTLAVRYSNLAMVEQALGNLPEAKRLMEQAIGIEQQTYAADHPTLAVRYHNLAFVERDLGNLPEAVDLARRAYRIWRDRLGTDHPNTKLATDWLSKHDPEFWSDG